MSCGKRFRRCISSIIRRPFKPKAPRRWWQENKQGFWRGEECSKIAFAMPTRKPLHGHVSRGHSKHSKLPQNHCFACGKNNPHSMHLKVYIDEAKSVATCNARLTRREHGPPGHAHGGAIT